MGIFIGSDSWTGGKFYVSSKGYEAGQGTWTCDSPKYYTTWEAKQKATKDAAHAARPGFPLGMKTFDKEETMQMRLWDLVLWRRFNGCI
jgi:hypothetical protein